ncbi:winged helix-turn-helix transcriptional regulator [Streptomyces albus subsp. chlorinus]|uniref:MarR family transcriptional regulator n=1 Tax=Streptomyces albus TaxID=1888 RepID=UPI00156E0670|nr:winged helix-turn-helix transcriptional regulator [Streptomyces albus subsp. chlorinus]
MNDDESRPAFERGTGFLLSRLGMLATRSWSAFLTEHGLTQSQYATLVALREHGPLGQRRLARLVAIDARNLVAVLDSLSAAGWVRREADPHDRRRRRVRLTTAGTALTDRLAVETRGGQDTFLAPLGENERRHLNELLQRLYDAHSR